MSFMSFGSSHDGVRAAVQEATRLAMRPFLQAQERQQSGRFEELDRDNDGLVTRDELTRGLLGTGERSGMTLADQLRAEQLADFALQRHDRDGDGALSVRPSLKRQERAHAQDLKGLDRDCDGRVTREELRARFGHGGAEFAVMVHYDLDHDGAIDVGK